MSDAKTDDPDLTEIAETDFSTAIRPNRYAMLRGDFQHAVFIEPQLWEHFGSEERVIEALRLLVELARRETRSVA